MGKRKVSALNLWNWAFHSKISRKISTVFFGFLLLSVILTYFSYRYVSKEYVLSNMEQHSRQTLTSIRSNIVEMVENTNNSYSLLLKSGISDLTKLPLKPTDRKFYDNYLFTIIDSYNHLDSIYIMNLKGQLYGVDKFGIKTPVIHSVTEAPWYQSAMDAKGSCILSLHAGNIFLPDYSEDFLSAVRVINDLETQKPIGFSIMNIPTSTRYLSTSFSHPISRLPCMTIPGRSSAPTAVQRKGKITTISAPSSVPRLLTTVPAARIRCRPESIFQNTSGN